MDHRPGHWTRSFYRCVPAARFGPWEELWPATKPPQPEYELIQEVRSNMRNTIRKIISVAIAIMVIALVGLFLNGYGQTGKTRAASGAAPLTQQPLFTEYKGVKLGMEA